MNFTRLRRPKNAGKKCPGSPKLYEVCAQTVRHRSSRLLFIPFLGFVRKFSAIFSHTVFTSIWEESRDPKPLIPSLVSTGLSGYRERSQSAVWEDQYRLQTQIRRWVPIVILAPSRFQLCYVCVGEICQDNKMATVEKELHFTSWFRGKSTGVTSLLL